MEIVLLGHMGRDEALADRLEGHKLHVLGQWANPGLVEKAESSGGQFEIIDSIKNSVAVADFVESKQPDMFLTNFDDALAAGVVDVIKDRVVARRMPDLLLPCPNRGAARVEWDKFYLRQIIDAINPKYNPHNFMAVTAEQVATACATFKELGKQIAIKPRNLTGGKGVKVQGKHFDTLAQGEQYALQVLAQANQTGVEIQEKLEGHEFTLQVITDGSTIIEPPVTYDYPYREDGDHGPGTGGMGTFTMRDGRMPFVTASDYQEALALTRRVLQEVRDRGHDYKGVLYPTFFKTKDGLKIVEINARGGDPELINILDLMDDNTDFAEVLESIALGELADDSVSYKKLASAMLYLVSPAYAYKDGPVYDFEMDTEKVQEMGCKVRFAAAEKTAENRYRTAASSRIVGLSALAKTPWEARQKIITAIHEGFAKPLPLEFRKDVASKSYIDQLR